MKKIIKKLELTDKNKRLLFTLSGVAVAASSLITVADYFNRKRKAKAVHIGQLFVGIAGVVSGAVLIAEPEIRSRRTVVVEELFNDADATLAQNQIRETLNDEVDREPAQVAPQTPIEVDNETSIEDFI